jgi:hypothetical protein
MTILLSIIRLATAEAENPEKTTECMAPFSHKLNGNSFSLVNKYKLDLLWLCLVPAKHLPFCKPVDAIRYRKYASSGHLKYYGSPLC